MKFVDCDGENRTFKRECFNMKIRSRARALVLQCLYELDFTKHIFVQAFRTHTASEVIVENVIDFAGGLNRDALAFAKELGQTTESHKAELDALISTFAPDWPLAQVPAIDRNILRIAVCELHFLRDAPGKVVINEAVELAKLFGGDSSPRFVNGVLGAVISQQESTPNK